VIAAATLRVEKALPEILEGTGRRGLIVTLDLSKRGDAERLAKTALEQMGRVDILVNNAGTNVPSPIDQVKDEDWDRVIELNLSTCMVLTRALVPQMKERRWGRIIHISSVLGLGSKVGGMCIPRPNEPSLVGSGKCLDLGVRNHRECIAPGPFSRICP
jgi:NAD(P)-dependent dehydrogenase (short-subunit alcohol dehydrogenase family)